MTKSYLKLVVAVLFATNVMAQNVPSYVPKNGLVGWWPFNGNAKDESGNGFNGIVNGATLTVDRNGVANSAYSFDGIGNYIDFGNDSKLTIRNGTINLWFSYNSNSRMTILSKLNYNDASNEQNSILTGYLYYVNGPTGICSFYKYNSNCLPGKGWVGPENNLDYSDGKYHMLTSVNSESSISLYIDGELKSSILTPSKKADSCSVSNLILGRNWQGDKTFYKGKIDDISIYNRVLSEQEIKQLYNACKKETASSNSFNTVIYSTSNPFSMIGQPSSGVFIGSSVVNNTFMPSKAKLGINRIKYVFQNSSGCQDTSNFSFVVSDTIGNVCTTNDTVNILKIKLKLTTGIKANQYTNMAVYPNPTSDLLIIDVSDVQALIGYKYRILDLQGKEIYNALVTTAKTEVSLKSLGTKGVYVLHVIDANNASIQTKQIVLE